MRIATKITIGLVTVWGLGNLIQTLLVCHFIDGKWNLVVFKACRSFYGSHEATGSFNFITNIIISLLPIYTIWSLGKVAVSTRLYLTAVFMSSTM